MRFDFILLLGFSSNRINQKTILHNYILYILEFRATVYLNFCIRPSDVSDIHSFYSELCCVKAMNIKAVSKYFALNVPKIRM